MSPTGSELGIAVLYHEALRTPGISALFASIRKHRRQILNLRWYPRRRPQIEQRLYFRVLNFGSSFCLTFQRMLAIESFSNSDGTARRVSSGARGNRPTGGP